MPTPAEPTSAEQEAFEYWGYLFKPDKTGTEKLKKLLRALHKLIGTRFEAYDSTDLTPAQLARFYRDLNGDYDQLFLSIPPATIAFIYKNLGCLHSMQPLPSAAAENRYCDPTIPALKIEGWIMWETIQLLLGPEEHAGFLMTAVKKWDLKDPDTGEQFPKLLPRSCFPAAPDAHMMAWYEGVSDRLRREAEEEASMRITAVEEDAPRQIESADRSHRRHNRDHSHDIESEEPVETKKSSALSYFKNPLFKNNEGRPGVVRRNSKHPTLVERGMSAATSVGHVVRNIGSPSLWDGGSGGGGGGGGSSSKGSKEKERERERERDKDKDGYRDKERERERSHSRRDSHRERDRRRKSLPHAHHFRGGSSEDDTPSPRVHHRHSVVVPRRGSTTNSPASDRDGWDYSNSPRRTPVEKHHHHRTSTSPSDHSIRHSKSHDPTPSPKDYFPPYETYKPRRSSAHHDAQSPGGAMSPGRTPVSDHAPVSRDDIIHTGFMPTASPLFATQVARNDNRPNTHFIQPNYIPRSSARDRYDSPSRSPLGRVPSTRHDDSTRRPPNGSSTSGQYNKHGHNGILGPPPLQQRPKVARFETPANGPSTRAYAKDGPLR
ncbi:hypothetical protein CAC42_4085 [Sphaceloma murrayae]|uniref:DUF7514 domain-containing protein n=1 Tax=Sphaceloma murrayae TaxID=2082308 RepID=A0A2K1QLE1_9PEZI|nr:hypothetical protein CAC42_4085 [Sphaceloma murrayae]